MTAENITLTIIGCGDAFSSGGRLQTCFHVETPEGAFLIDCGAGAVAGLKQQKCSLAKIDTIIISHFHGDHYGGLPYFLLEAAVSGRKEPLTIISPPGCREKAAALLDLLYPGSKVLEKLDLHFIEYEGTQELVTAYLSLTTFPVVHIPETNPHGLRISTAGKVISYSGDTGWDPVLNTIARAADLFICECNFYESKSGVHLDYLTLAEHLPAFTCKQILLTHLGDEIFANREKILLACAESGMQVRL